MRAFAGHSLGEFSSLVPVANILPNSSLVDVVFYRSLTCSVLLERDEQSRLNDAMCHGALNPSRVGNTFDVAALHEIADTLICEGLSLGDRKLQRRGAALISHVSIQLLMYSSGSTICLRRRACCITSSYECPQLSQDAAG
jgi:Acyl transferase domain